MSAEERDEEVRNLREQVQKLRSRLWKVSVLAIIGAAGLAFPRGSSYMRWAFPSCMVVFGLVGLHAAVWKEYRSTRSRGPD